MKQQGEGRGLECSVGEGVCYLETQDTSWDSQNELLGAREDGNNILEDRVLVGCIRLYSPLVVCGAG